MADMFQYPRQVAGMKWFEPSTDDGQLVHTALLT